MIKTAGNIFQNPKIQCLALLVSIGFIGAIFVASYSKRIFKENIVILEKPSDVAKALAKEIEVGVHFNGFPAFSIKDAKFTFDGMIWFKFNQGTEGIETLESFSIKNMVHKKDSEVFYKSKPIIKLIDDKVLIVYHVQITFTTEIIYKKFPIGDHRINLIIENRAATARELLFSTKPENVTFNDDLMVDNWRPIKAHTSSGVMSTAIGSGDKATSITYPAVSATIDLENMGIRSLFSLYFPLFILFFIGLLSLSVGIFNSNRISIIGASFPTLVLFRLVIDAVSPDIGYATHIDFIYYVLVGLSFIILCFQTYLVFFVDKNLDYAETVGARIKNRLETINGLIFILTLVALLVIMVFDYFN